MKNIDEIDRLFQDVFETFEAFPDDSVKEKIDNALFNKKRKRGFFIWFFPALLTVGFFSYSPFSKFNGFEKNTNQKVKSTKIEAVSYSKSPACNKTCPVEAKNQKLDPKLKSSSHSDLVSPLSIKNQNHTQQRDRKLTIVSLWSNSKTDKLNSVKNRKRGNSDSTFKRLPKGVTKDYESAIVLTDNRENDENLNLLHPDIELLKGIWSGANIDSILLEMKKIQLESKPKVDKWHLSFRAGYDMIAKREFVPLFESIDLANSKTNYIQYYSQFYTSKVECIRPLNTNWSVLVGVGYQFNNLYISETNVFKDSLIYQTGWPSSQDTTVYINKAKTERQRLFVSSLVLPIGITISERLSDKISLKCAFGTELYIGKLSRTEPINQSITPTFHTLGLNGYLRPEFIYSMRKLNFGIYGTVNHACRNQLSWTDFTTRKPRLGGGLSMYFPLR